MPLYTSVSQVTRVALASDPYIKGLQPSQAAFRVAWSAKDAGGVTQISYSFPWADGVASLFTGPYGRGENTAAVTGAVNTDQAAQITNAFGAWANVANIAFTQVAETADGQVGDIRVAFTSAVSPGYWGYSLGVSDGLSNAHGDIWIDDAIIGQSFEPGTYNFMAMMHEIGHSLGLKHSFETPKIPASFDNQRYTIMSYTAPDKVWWRDPATDSMRFLIKTPMVYDILAIQKVYGANTSFHKGDDSYAFNPAAPSFEAIWDAGGTDTFSIAAFTGGCTVDLHPGAYSSLAYDSVSLTSNIGIAFGCAIENALGGAGGDVLVGGAGNDMLDGGAGSDTVSYAAGSAAVRVSLAISGAQATGGGGNDTLTGIENLIGGTGADLLVGDGGANVLDGGGGADQLAGAGGADVLIGGAGRDMLLGGDGGDLFRFATIKDLPGIATTTADAILDFSTAQGDLIDLSGIDAIKQTSAVNDAFAWIGSGAFTKHAGELRYVVSAGVGLVSGDLDGNGTADFAIRIDGGAALAATDFLL